MLAGGVQVPGRGRQVTVAGEAEPGPARRCRLEAGAGCGRRARAVADLVVVPWAGLQVAQLHVVEVRGLRVEPVGEAHASTRAGSAWSRRAAAARAARRCGRAGARRSGPRVGQRRRGLGHGARRRPGHGDLGGRVAAPGEPQLLRRRGGRQQHGRGRRPGRRRGLASAGWRESAAPVTPARPAAAPTTTTPLRNVRRETPPPIPPSSPSPWSAAVLRTCPYRPCLRTLRRPGEPIMAPGERFRSLAGNSGRNPAGCGRATPRRYERRPAHRQAPAGALLPARVHDAARRSSSG